MRPSKVDNKPSNCTTAYQVTDQDPRSTMPELVVPMQALPSSKKKVTNPTKQRANGF